MFTNAEREQITNSCPVEKLCVKVRLIGYKQKHLYPQKILKNFYYATKNLSQKHNRKHSPLIVRSLLRVEILKSHNFILVIQQKKTQETTTKNWKKIISIGIVLCPLDDWSTDGLQVIIAPGE